MNAIWTRLLLMIAAFAAMTLLASSTDASRALVGASTGSVSGVVLDVHGHPVAGANVEIVDAHHHTVQSAITGRRGSFAFPHLDPGTYVVNADKHGVGHGSATAQVHAHHDTQVHVTLH